jgi:hypothetical protein
MKMYIGQTRSHKLVAELAAAGFGECVQPDEWLPRRAENGWFLDNAAFKDWKAGRPFDGERFRRAFERLASAPAPDFIVVPDIVAGGSASLDLSCEWWLEVLELARSTWGEDVPLYVAVQDGMSRDDILGAIGLVAGRGGIFIGGTTEWKLAAAPGIILEAHRAGVPVHIGRIGSGKRIVWARAIGADSVDSCIPLREERKREIAEEATGLELSDAAAVYPAGVKMAQRSAAGFVRRAFLRGELDEDVAGIMRRAESLHADVHMARQLATLERLKAVA